QEDLVRVGIIKIADRGALWYMDKIADKYGFRVSYSVYPTPGDAAKAVAKGDVDIAAPGLANAITLRNQGKPVVVIAGFSKGGLTVVGRKDLGLTTFAQLKGHKVGLIKGSNADLSFLGMLEKYKISYSEQPGKDVQILYGKSYPSLSAALLTKNIDAACFPDPFGTQAISRGYANKIGHPYDTPIGEPVRPLITSEKFYNENQALLVRMLKCLTESSKIFQTQPAVAEAFVTKTMFGGFLSGKEYRTMATNGSYTTDITVEHIQTTIDMMNRYGMIELDPKNPLKASSFVKLDLLKKAK
ncbi:MAG: ABC transporter substrate-binding protein, partial [Chlorobiales bacterium]|nr:ABC transporter substrate-binding protein [Chlorobiales bacterium]